MLAFRKGAGAQDCPPAIGAVLRGTSNQMADSAPEIQYVKKPVPTPEPGRARVSAPPAPGVRRPKAGVKRPDPMAMAALLRIMAHASGK
jgi:hypothetical protein